MLDFSMDTDIDRSFLSAATIHTPTKARSFSDPPTVAATLAPSPTILENTRRSSKDDHAVPTTPKASRRAELLVRGLSLQMPAREMPSPAELQRAEPLSPQLDENNIYSFVQAGSPATSLPRHSRGLDFSRACTNLHHSTLPEQHDPDSSPVISQKGMNIPQRKMSISSMALDSPNLGPSSAWGSLAPERSAVSSSLGSVNMLGSETESSDSDEDASMIGDENDDPIFATPQVQKLHNPSASTPFAAQTPGGNTWNAGNAFSPAAASLMKNIRRTRLQKNSKRTRKNSSSASNSGYSSLASPRTTSPPPMKSIETGAGNGYFGWAKAAHSRRESLALGTDGLHLSSGNDSGDEASNGGPGTPGVVRRPVTRRGNLLPKTKGFARIRAALIEEAAPVDTEVRREAETIRQVRERDNSVVDVDILPRPQTATAQSSPSLLPAVPESAQEDFGKEFDLGPANKISGIDFSLQASRNSGGLNFWNRFDPSMRTPPPPSFGRNNSSAMSDTYMDSPQLGEGAFIRRPRAQSSASDASDAFGPSASNAPAPASMTDDMHLKKFKRRREDDFDIATIKRRAVSPGMSTQNSPVLTQSPSHRDTNNTWGQPPERKKEQGSAAPLSANSDVSQSTQLGPPLHPVRSGSNGSNASLPSGGNASQGTMASQGKKLGLQGMTDTNDGLMKMSIE